MKRRALLATAAAAGASALAGCSALGDGDPPAGSLRFANDHHLPHVVGLSVTGVGAEPVDAPPGPEGPLVTGEVAVPHDQRELTTSASVDPGETRQYDGVFTRPVWYGVVLTLDGPSPAGGRSGRRVAVPYNPAPPGDDGGWVLVARVLPDGDLAWEQSTTPNVGDLADHRPTEGLES